MFLKNFPALQFPWKKYALSIIMPGDIATNFS